MFSGIGVPHEEACDKKNTKNVAVDDGLQRALKALRQSRLFVRF